ncbi:MAG: hypothetical protein PHQ74_10650 [Crocinitomicaceae bacterium]|nr:hypothetical protein [Crocinitomicaceae bacterium]
MQHLKFGSALSNQLAKNLPNKYIDNKNMNKILIIIIIFLSHLTYGQTTGKYISNPNMPSSTILKLRKNQTFKFTSTAQVAEKIKQTGKWKVENDTLFLYHVNQPICRIGLFEIPVKWIISENKTCGIPELKPDYHECLMKKW